MVFLGILEDKHLQHVPATVILSEVLSEEEAQRIEATAELKHGTGRNADIILIPQPSQDPNDPLNWPASKKWVIMIIIAYGSTLYASVLAPLLSPALVVIAMDLNVSVGHVTVISGYMLLVAACSGPLVSAFSRKYGKRFILILSSLLGLIGTVVGSAADSYDGLKAARIIQGGSISAFESLAVSMIGDLFFVHERGYWMTFIQFILGAASNFSAVVVGPVAANLGWRYLFRILIAFSAFELILLILFVPETAYNRDHRYSLDELAGDKLPDLAAIEGRDATPTPEKASSSDVVQVENTASRSPTFGSRRTFVQELALFSGAYSDDSLVQLTLAPFAACLNLAVLWMVIVTGGLAAFFVAQSYDMAQIFMAPPYNLTAASVGYLSLGPFLGGLLGSLLLGATLDPIVKRCAKRNGGVYEPEYRLLGIIPSLLTGVGLFAFGYMCQSHYSYYATATMHGMDLFGIICAAVSASTYVIDAYREMSSEIFIVNMAFKNALFYGFSYFVNDWTAVAGPATVFYVFGGISFAMVCTAPILFFWGKRYRSFWHRRNFLGKLGMRTHAEM